MVEVYLAQDTKLDRKVALKILPSEVVANYDRMDALEIDPLSPVANLEIAQLLFYERPRSYY